MSAPTGWMTYSGDPPDMLDRTMGEIIARHVAAVVEAENLALERDCAVALALTDFDRWGTLQVVYVDVRTLDARVPPAVACMIRPDRWDQLDAR